MSGGLEVNGHWMSGRSVRARGKWTLDEREWRARGQSGWTEVVQGLEVNLDKRVWRARGQLTLDGQKWCKG